MATTKQEIVKHEDIASSNEGLTQFNDTGLVKFNTDEDELGIEDLPRLVLLQPLSPAVTEEEGKAGDFYIEGMGVIDRPITVVPIVKGLSRALFLPIDPDDDDSDNVKVCSSNDGKTAVFDAEAADTVELPLELPTEVCVKCPYNQWTNGKKPICTEFRSLVLDLPFEGFKVLWTVKGTALTPVRKNLQALANAKGYGNVAFTLNSKRPPRARFSYFIPDIRVLRNKDKTFVHPLDLMSMLEEDDD